MICLSMDLLYGNLSVVNIKIVFSSMKTYSFGKDPKCPFGQAVAEWLECGISVSHVLNDAGSNLP